ncbi:hypothetical protein [Simkania negevensis]|uniref:Uncharacterized protein n=1 Tax=Simkania negevensis (strain ATCC VR-1471 / DSM 27360 / Z) TaxID=331113 RepID=F8L5F0_SIMNZ|nr:hypothetical protein [Simkania negevensis]MCB1068244.1 hypothetical protein [Simkania sp.]MCP5490436.1 hypothetical protein [Chlamydiales bacterium]CCB89259.1 unknown protein [Simkania negevensis Z]
MTCDALCIYRQKTFTSDFASAFLGRTTDHLIVATVANSLLSYFFKVSEVKIGILQGAVTALVVNVTHHLSHLAPGDENEELRAVVVTAGMLWGSIYFFPDIATWFEKEATFYDSLKFGAVSWMSIALCNRFYH